MLEALKPSIPHVCGTIRWLAPEILNFHFESESSVDSHNYTINSIYGSACIPNFASDLYALGMLLYEVISWWNCPTSPLMNKTQIYSHQIPYHHLKPVSAVILAKSRGENPPQPGMDATFRGMCSSVWCLIEQCWHPDPSGRPKAGDVLFGLSSPAERLSRYSDDMTPDGLISEGALVSSDQVVGLWRAIHGHQAVAVKRFRFDGSEDLSNLRMVSLLWYVRCLYWISLRVSLVELFRGAAYGMQTLFRSWACRGQIHISRPFLHGCQTEICRNI